MYLLCEQGRAVQGSGSSVQGLNARSLGSGSRVQGSRFKVQDSRFQVCSWLTCLASEAERLRVELLWVCSGFTVEG